jgi:hypothetical protein
MSSHRVEKMSSDRLQAMRRKVRTAVRRCDGGWEGRVGEPAASTATGGRIRRRWIDAAVVLWGSGN